jgi:hypothetical protein
MASVSQVRSLIDSVLGTYIGSYNLPDSSIIPALWVRGSQSVPKDWTVTGTECVIEEVPSAQNIPTMSQSVFLNLLWTVNLTSYDTTQTLETPRLLLLQAFPDIKDVVYVPQTDISYETLRVTIPDYSNFSEIK